MQSLSHQTSDRLSSLPSEFQDSAPLTLVYGSECGLSQPFSLEDDPLFDQQSIGQMQKTELESTLPQTQIHTEQRSDYHLKFFSPRSHSEIRNSYIEKLSNRGYISKQPQKKYRHRIFLFKQTNLVFIFDWDDTLLCTSYFKSKYNFSDRLSQKDTVILKEIDTHVVNLLRGSLERGDIAIITNAVEGWVQFSGGKYLPKSLQFLKEKSVSVISARSEFSTHFPDSVDQWKVSAFQKLNLPINRHVLLRQAQLITNIICVGDSAFEMQAGQTLAQSFERSLLKTVKFRQNPKIQELSKQQDLLHRRLEEIVSSSRNLTIKLERKK